MRGAWTPDPSGGWGGHAPGLSRVPNRRLLQALNKAVEPGGGVAGV